MQISLLDTAMTDHRTLHKELSLDMEEISFAQGTFPLQQDEPLILDAVNLGNRVLDVSIRGSVSVVVPCDRCLKPVRVRIPFESCQRLDLKKNAAQRIQDLDECSYLDGTDLDIDAMVRQEILMNWPLKILCRQDCAGLCSRCGKNLGEGPCDCAKEPKDPRMAAISDIFKQFKEV